MDACRSCAKQVLLPFLTAYSHSSWEPAAWSTATVLLHPSCPQPGRAVPQICPTFSQAVCSLFPGLFGLFKHTQHCPAHSCSLVEGDVVPCSKGAKSTVHNLARFPRLQNEGSSSILLQYVKKNQKNPTKHLCMCPTSIVKSNSVNNGELECSQQEFRIWGNRISSSGTSSDPVRSLGSGHHS